MNRVVIVILHIIKYIIEYVKRINIERFLRVILRASRRHRGLPGKYKIVEKPNRNSLIVELTDFT